MKFKSIAILSIFCTLLLTGCDSKEKNDENSTQSSKPVKVQRNDFQLTTVNNETINISVEDDKIIVDKYPDKIVLLDFFATWCPPCKAEMPTLVKMQNDYKNDFVIISVLLEHNKANKELEEFIKKYKVNFDITNSEENYAFAKRLGDIKSIPTQFLIGKDSKLFQRYVGIVPYEMMELDIKKLLAK